MTLGIHESHQETGPHITIVLIQNVVARYYSMTRKELLLRTRKHHVAHPRQVAMYLACHVSRLSLPEIGRRFGGFDHTTVMYARDCVEERCSEDPKLRSNVETLKKLLLSGKAGEWLSPPQLL